MQIRQVKPDAVTLAGHAWRPDKRRLHGKDAMLHSLQQIGHYSALYPAPTRLEYAGVR